jgi:hypothetical protein
MIVLTDEQIAGKRPAIRFTIWPQAIEIKYPHSGIFGSFTAKSLYRLIRNLTPNQRVTGSGLARPPSKLSTYNTMHQDGEANEFIVPPINSIAPDIPLPWPATPAEDWQCS